MQIDSEDFETAVGILTFIGFLILVFGALTLHQGELSSIIAVIVGTSLVIFGAYFQFRAK